MILLEVRAQRVKVTLPRARSRVLRNDAPARAVCAGASIEDSIIRSLDPLAYCLVRDGDDGEIDRPEVFPDHSHQRGR